MSMTYIPLSPAQAKLAAENIRRCKAYAASQEKPPLTAADGKEIRAKKRTHEGVHTTYASAPLGVSLLDLSKNSEPG
jgi:hypothetical protein